VEAEKGVSSRERRLLVVVALVILLGAVSVGSFSRTPVGRGRHDPAQASIVLTVLLTLVGLLAAGLLGVLANFLLSLARRRGRGRGEEEERPRPPLVQRLLAVAAAICLLGGLVVLFIVIAKRHKKAVTATTGAARQVSHRIPPAHSLPLDAHAAIGTIAVVAIIAALGLSVTIAGRALHRRHVRASPPIGLDELAGVLRRGDSPGDALVVAAIADLEIATPEEEPDPRKAILASYLAMCDRLASLGLSRHEAETPREYLTRVVARTERPTVSSERAGDALFELTALFGRARYSEREVGETERARAIAARGILADELQAGLEAELVGTRA